VKAGALDRVPTRRFVALVVLACVALTAYVSHTYTTNELAREAERLRLENERLHLRHDRLQTERDSRIGPAVILERAAALGLVEGHAYAQPIKMTGGG
jgi:cell division protein FtsL